MAAHTASQEMQFFSVLMRCGSLAAAARELQVSPPAVSNHRLAPGSDGTRVAASGQAAT